MYVARATALCAAAAAIAYLLLAACVAISRLWEVLGQPAPIFVSTFSSTFFTRATVCGCDPSGPRLGETERLSCKRLWHYMHILA